MTMTTRKLLALGLASAGVAALPVIAHGDDDGGLTSGTEAQVWISAPIFPDARVFQHYGYSNTLAEYPADASAQKALVDDSTCTFQSMFDFCQNLHNVELVDPASPDITPEQIASNYGKVARCAYENYGAKPYLMPQLVKEFDICAEKMGPDWALPTEAQVSNWSEQVFTDVASALTTIDDFGGIYFGLIVFVKDAAGNVKVADLAPGATTRFHDLPAGQDPKILLTTMPINGKESFVGLRCVREVASSP